VTVSADNAEFRRKAVSGVGWIAADKWSNRLMGLVVLTVLGRLLTPTEFGLVALATAFMALANVFVDQGFGRAIVQRKELTSGDTSTAFWISLASSGLLALLTVIFAPLISSLFGEGDRLTPIIQWLSVGLLVNALSSMPAALLEREFRFKSLAIRRFVGTVLGGASAILLALLGFGVWALVAQTLVAAVAGLITLWLATTWRPRLEFSRASLRALWAVGGSIIGIELIGLVNSQADRLLIGAFLDAEALGYYYLAMRIVSIMVELFSSVFSGVALTTFSRLQSDRPRMLAWFYKLTSLSSSFAIPFFALAAITAPVVIPLVFGPQWEGSVTIFRILCFLGALNAVAYFDRSVLLAVGRAKSALLLTLGQSVLGVVLVVVALPMGVVAVAVAVALRQYLYWPVRLITLKRNVGVAPGRYWAQWFRPFLVSLVVIAGSLGIGALLPGLIDAPVPFLAVHAGWAAVGFGLGLWVVDRTLYSDVLRVLRRKL
jgi:O-antigen/teichoic acid export membrane protein